MTRIRFFLTIGAIFSVALAQERIPPPAAPAPPAPPAAPWIDADEVREQVEAVREQAEAIREQAQEAAREAREVAQASIAGTIGGIRGSFAFAPQPSPRSFERGRSRDDDRNYERGQKALDNRRWDEALELFTQVAGAGGPRADGALYWKAYAYGKLGRRDDALAAIAELRKSYASSRWLDDTKVLELELRQASGQPVKPESENDEELKLMALNGLVQSDPDRALPLLENLLKTSTSAKLKERAIFVLAQSNSTRGKQLLEQVARGGAGNPDLQLKAISYIAATSKKTDNRALLWEIYSGSSDVQVKRAILNGLMAARDTDHLLQVAKSEKEPMLRRTAIQALGSMDSPQTADALVAIYASETDPAIKRNILDSLHGQRNAKAIVDLARKETDPAMKREIVSRLSNMKSKEASDYLMELLK
jgi:HEAT repeat protein